MKPLRSLSNLVNALVISNLVMLGFIFVKISPNSSISFIYINKIFNNHYIQNYKLDKNKVEKYYKFCLG
jgi:hypothetical protein